MKKVLGILAVVAVVVVLGVSFPTAPLAVKGDPGAPGNPGTPGKDGHSPVVKMVGDRLSVDGVLSQSLRGPAGNSVLGSVTGPDEYLAYKGLNDVQTYSTYQKFTQGTTTVCSIPSPNATSTLVRFLVHQAVATTTDVFYNIGRAGLTSEATTTLFNKAATTTATFTVSALTDDFIPSVVASTSFDNFDTNSKMVMNYPIILLPREKINVAGDAKNQDMTQTGTKGFNMTGDCEATFQVFQKP